MSVHMPTDWDSGRGTRCFKVYGKGGDKASPEKRYSPSECTGTMTQIIEGDPDGQHISTSYVESHNLTMRMPMRRFIRLTNAFSKRLEYVSSSVALNFMHYNFYRIHKTLRVTPVIDAGVTDRLWEIGDIVDMVEAAAPKHNRPATYKKRGQISNRATTAPSKALTPLS